MQLKSRHQHFSVTVGEMTHIVSFDPSDDGWFVGEVAPEVAEKCILVSPSAFQLMTEERSVGGTSPAPSDLLTPKPAPGKPRNRA